MKWKGPSDYGCRWRDVFAECDERVGAVVSLQNTQTRVSGLRNLAWVCVCVHMCAWMSFIMWNTALKADFFCICVANPRCACVRVAYGLSQKKAGWVWVCMYRWMDGWMHAIVQFRCHMTAYIQNITQTSVSSFIQEAWATSKCVCVCVLVCVFIFWSMIP